MHFLEKIILLSLVIVSFFSQDHLMADWKLVFADNAQESWEKKWSLDGLKATVGRQKEGLILTSGKTYQEDASHCVLWTKQNFIGDVKIEYDFTRLDHELTNIAVCILYIQATGLGQAPYSENIFDWNHLRQVPKMSTYFNYMNGYHISYSTTGGTDFNYIRARRYPSLHKDFDKDTRILPSYEKIDLFKPDETWHLCIEKRAQELTFSASRDKEKYEWKWVTSQFPQVTHGPIGLRQMATRQSLYANFKVWQP